MQPSNVVKAQESRYFCLIPCPSRKRLLEKRDCGPGSLDRGFSNLLARSERVYIREEKHLRIDLAFDPQTKSSLLDPNIFILLFRKLALAGDCCGFEETVDFQVCSAYYEPNRCGWMGSMGAVM